MVEKVDAKTNDAELAAPTRGWTRIWGAAAIVSAICCMTPVLVWLFAALGLGAAVAWIDIIVLPAFVVFSALFVHALYQRRKRHG